MTDTTTPAVNVDRELKRLERMVDKVHTAKRLLDDRVAERNDQYRRLLDAGVPAKRVGEAAGVSGTAVAKAVAKPTDAAAAD